MWVNYHHKKRNTMTEVSIGWPEKKKENMTYRNQLKKRIEELNREISEDKDQIEALKKELKRLEMAEFEEDLAEDSNQQLLKG